MRRLDVVYGMVQNAVGDTLMVLNQKNGLWTLPGGGVERGESLPESLKREMSEEVGLDVEPGSLAALNELRDAERGRHILFFTFHCQARVLKPTIVRPEEILEWRWMGPDEAAKHLVYYPHGLPGLIAGNAPYVDEGQGL